MNLTNIKELNSVPLRRVQGFDFDGASYLSNNSLDIKQDFATIVKVKLDSVITNQDLWASYYVGDSINECTLRIRSDNNVYASIGNNYLGRATANIDISNLLGTIVTFAIRRVSNKVTVLVNNILYESVDSIVDGVENQIDPVIGARHRFDYSNESFVFFCDIPFLEVLEIQDTLTDAQLLEFANLARFTDHSDYATFNKNAYYPLDYNTKDYSGNNNDGTVTGTEQYEIIERGIKSINDVEVLSKRGFKNSIASYITTDADIVPDGDNTFMFWLKTKTDTYRNGIGWTATSGAILNRFYIQTVGNLLYFGYGDANYNTPIVNDTKYHVCFSVSGTTVTCYIDGIPVSSFTANWNNAITDLFQLYLYVNENTVVTRDETEGTIWDVKLFDSALTEAQIKEEMNGNVLPAIGYWPLQEDTKDYSNNGNDGIVTGTEQYETVQNGLTDWQDPVLP